MSKETEAHKKWRETNKEKCREYRRKWNEKNPGRTKQAVKSWWSIRTPKTMLFNTKNNAKKKGFDFNIDESDLVIPKICPVLGIELDGTSFDTTPSVDRVDSSKGYVKGNVCVISMRANRLKSDASIEELQSILSYMKGTSYVSDTN